MDTVRLGSQGMEVSRQGLGCMSLTGFYGRAFDERAALDTLTQALDLGVTLLDTADIYGDGLGDDSSGFGGNEAFVGRAIRGLRSSVVLATKFGYQPRRHVGNRKEQPGPRGDAAYVASACDASLQRLGVDHIDLYICHRLDPRIAVEETIGAMADLVTAGKVRFLGVSSVSATELRTAAAVHPISVLQSEWSLWTRDIEVEELAVARELGVGIMPYSPLGRGFLTGQVRSFNDLGDRDLRRDSPRFQGNSFALNLQLVEHLTELATTKGCSTAQLALAWLQAMGADVVAIPGADRTEQVIDNVGALDVRLDAGDLAAIEALFPFGVAAGAPYRDLYQVRDAVTAQLGQVSTAS